MRRKTRWGVRAVAGPPGPATTTSGSSKPEVSRPRRQPSTWAGPVSRY